MSAVVNSTNYIRRDLNHILKSSKSHNKSFLELLLGMKKRPSVKFMTQVFHLQN